MNRWPRISGCERSAPMTGHFLALLRNPGLASVLYATLVDPDPVVGLAQQACELDRRLARLSNNNGGE